MYDVRQLACTRTASWVPGVFFLDSNNRKSKGGFRDLAISRSRTYRFLARTTKMTIVDNKLINLRLWRTYVRIRTVITNNTGTIYQVHNTPNAVTLSPARRCRSSMCRSTILTTAPPQSVAAAAAARPPSYLSTFDGRLSTVYCPLSTWLRPPSHTQAVQTAVYSRNIQTFHVNTGTIVNNTW